MRTANVQTMANCSLRQSGPCVGRHKGLAAFFDIDGTLCAGPTLERQFARELCRQRQIRLQNAFAWLNEALRLLPYGSERACWANKQYLHDISTSAAGRALDACERDIMFFGAALERVRWHAERHHAIVLVTGTLECLAALVAKRLTRELGSGGFSGEILICATRLEEREGRWSGRVLGNTMRRREKASAVKSLAQEHGWKLADCWAYGDSANDRWMLDAVGHAVAVNPGRRLGRLARESGWLEMRWNSSQNAVQTSNERPIPNRGHTAGPAGQTL
jgi:HAD superfamily hydrolase (TIGR01490 family)